MQRGRCYLGANRPLFRDIISKILTECLQTPEQSLERWISLEAECFLEKTLQQTQIISYRLEANNSIKIKKAINGYLSTMAIPFARGHYFPLSPNLFQRTFWFLSTEWKCRAVSANVTALPSRCTAEHKPLFLDSRFCVTWILWHSCHLLSVLKSHTF